MKKSSILFLAAVTLVFANCKSKSSTKSSSGTTITETPTKNGEQTIKYRFIISLISISEGTDGEKYAAIDKFIQSHPKKPAYDLIAKGREGERDLCFHLKELSASEQKTFIEDVKKLAQGSDRVQFSENAERVKKQQ